MIHIVCGIDDKFVMPCGVLMSSVFENNKNEQIEFHVITAGLKNESTNSLQKIADNYNQRLSFVVVYKRSGIQQDSCSKHSTPRYEKMPLSGCRYDCNQKCKRFI